MMDMMRPKSSVSGFWRRFIVLACLTLVVAFGTVQVVHVHAHNDVSHTDCSLCVTAHVAVHLSNPQVLPAIVHVVSYVETVVPPARSTTLSTFALFTRPPPADEVLA
jgi:hypothetical protein